MGTTACRTPVRRDARLEVPAPEYLLLSEDVYRSGGTAPPEHLVHEIAQDLEGIGPVQTYFVEVGDLAGSPRSDPGSILTPARR